MIRPATEADIPRMVEMGREFYAAGFGDDRYDPEAAAEMVRGLIAKGAVFVSDAGMIGGVIAPLWCAPSHKIAVELFWWARDGQGMALLDAFEEWAREAGAHEVRMSNIEALKADRVAKRLQGAGYRVAETSFAKGLI